MRCPDCREPLLADGGATLLADANGHHWVPGAQRYEDVARYTPKPSHRCAIAAPSPPPATPAVAPPPPARNGTAAARAAKESPAAPPRFALTGLGALLAEPDQAPDYVVDGLLIAGGLSMAVAKPKVGKSTLARNVARAVARGEPFLGRATKQGAVVYLALEEKRSEVARHFRAMGCGDDPIHVHVGAAPEQALVALATAIKEHQPVLAVIDPVLKLVRLRDANDYAEVSRAFEPLIELARLSGCHLLSVHHLGKGERSGGDAILGSTALFGAVDAALVMKRREAVRTLETIQRYGTDLPETVIALDPETGLVSPAGDVAALEQARVKAAVLAALGGDQLAEADIKERVGGNNVQVSKAIRALLEGRQLARSGEGKKGSRYLYRAATAAAIDAPEQPDGGSPSERADADFSRFSRLTSMSKREKRESEKPDSSLSHPPAGGVGAVSVAASPSPPLANGHAAALPTCSICSRLLMREEFASRVCCYCEAGMPISGVI